MRRLFLLWIVGCVSLMGAGSLGMYERLGETVPLDLPFTDEEGQSVTFRELMAGKPAILTLNYYRCPGLCTPQLNDLAKTLSQLDLAENTDYKVITLSFHPGDTPELANSKKTNLLASMKRPYVADACFLVGSQENITQVTQSVGFRYQKEVSEEGMVNYIHPAALVVLSPEGKITRYLNGITQLPFDVKLALIEASEGKVGPTIAKTLLYCFAYDPENKTYVFAVEKLLAILLSLILLGFFIYLILSGRKRNKTEKDHE